MRDTEVEGAEGGEEQKAEVEGHTHGTLQGNSQRWIRARRVVGKR
jgi:hypothetical protein